MRIQPKHAVLLVAIFALAAFSCKTILINQVVKGYAKKAGESFAGFEVEDTSGNKIMLDTTAGSVLYIGYWAVWCGPCIGEMPDHNKMAQKLEGKDVTFVNVCLGTPDEKAKWRQLVREKQLRGLNYFVDRGEPRVLWAGNEGLPAHLLVGPGGKVLGSGLAPDEGGWVAYALLRAREGYTVKQSFKAYAKDGVKIDDMKKSDPGRYFTLLHFDLDSTSAARLEAQGY